MKLQSPLEVTGWLSSHGYHISNYSKEMKYLQPNLYHTYPLSCLTFVSTDRPMFIEAELALTSNKYKNFFLGGRIPCTILDCGVGASPDLDNPTAHVSSSSTWGVAYVNLAVDLKPRVTIIPDVLGSGYKTRVNYHQYSRLFKTYQEIGELDTKLMYVIQGQDEEEAKAEVEFVLNEEDISWVGFPRVVNYYSVSNDAPAVYLADRRQAFINQVLNSIKEAGKKIHLLGMNTLSELEFAARNGFSIDTRSASLAAIHKYDITTPRPANYKIDLLEAFTRDQSNVIINNMKILDDIFSHIARNRLLANLST